MEMDEDEIQSFVKIRNNLRKKAEELENEKERLKNVVKEDENTLRQLKALNAELKQEFNEKYAVYNQIPKDINKKEAKKLKSRIRELSEELEQLRAETNAQIEQNKFISDEIGSNSTTRDKKNSIIYIKHSLLSEMHELIEKGSSPEIILKKEKQIQLCDSLP